MGNIYIEVKVTLYFAMSQNGPIHFKNLAANAARFLKCVWPFYNIAKYRVNIMTIAPTMFMQFLVISGQISNMV